MSGKNGKGLGRGLEALFGQETARTLEEESRAQESGFRLLPVRQVEPNRDQPRKAFDPAALAELTESVKRHGVLSPITVRPLAGGGYQIVAGERRWRAARAAGLTDIPAMVVETDEEGTLELALIENLQRENLNPMEEAEGYALLMEQFGLTQDAVAERVGKSRPAVANSLRLLALAPGARQLVARGELTGGHGKALLAVKDPGEQEKLAQLAAQRRLSVRQTEAMARRWRRQDKAPAQPQPPQVDYAAQLARQLEGALGRRVTIQPGRRRAR